MNTKLTTWETQTIRTALAAVNEFIADSKAGNEYVQSSWYVKKEQYENELKRRGC